MTQRPTQAGRAALVNANGTLTARGVVYRDWVPPTVRRVYLPSMARAYP